MATSYPGGLDAFTNPTSGDDLDDSVGGRTHSQMHADVNDALEAVEGELGVNPSGASATVAARFTALDSTVAGLAPDPDVFDAVDYGAAVDGTTNDTAAWQAAITACAAAGGGVVTSSLAGVSVIGGALQSTGTANAQIILPDVHMLDAKQIGVTIRGPLEQSSVVSVVGAAQVPTSGLVLKSTLASGTGAVFGAYGSGTSYLNFTFVHLRMENLTVRTVTNPTITALDLRRVDSCTLENVIVDTGQYDTTLTEPTTSTSFGVRLPKNNNGAHIRADGLHVYGFYNGIEFSEHAELKSVSVGACNTGMVALAANHSSRIGRVLVGYCKYGLRFTGAHALDIDQWATEHAGSGWYQTTYDVDDASSFGKGFVRWWSVLQGVGAHNSFTKNGGTGVTTSRMSDAIGSGSGSLAVQDENGTAITGVTQLDFQGAGVTATSGTGEVVVTIPSGAGFVYRDRLVAVAGNATLTLGATPVANSPLVWVNGTIKWPTTDYTVAGNVLTFNTPLSASDVVAVQYHSAASSASESALTTPAAVLPADTFNRSNSATTMGTTTTGSATWVPAASTTWGISSNQAYMVSGAGAPSTTVESGVANCTVAVKLAPGLGDFVGLVLRSNGAGNEYLLQYDSANHQMALLKRVGGSGAGTVMTAVTITTLVSSDVVSVVMLGSSFTVKVNGTTIGSGTDATYNTQTRHGLWCTATTTRFDDFAVTA